MCVNSAYIIDSLLAMLRMRKFIIWSYSALYLNIASHLCYFGRGNNIHDDNNNDYERCRGSSYVDDNNTKK